ncbi:ATP-binding protein [Pseudomonas agarici]|uniref:ATP-binding protein n=1 Tax=Pseudomonas agarici TaxID=46677 RepID=UPI0015A11337|nr:ATP-binding protein [Pseudomonas agarici]NWB93729.1 response regulator [Pseudomonas agarici]
MFRIRRKIGVLLLVYIVGVSGYIYYLHDQAQRILIEGINNKLLHAALGAAAILGDQYHDALVDKHSKSEAEDLDAIRKLSRFNESMGTAFVYTVIKRGAKAILVSSSASTQEVEEGNFVRFFDPYPDASQALLDSFDLTTPSWIDYTDHWGDFRAVFVPMKSADGTPYVAGAEITLADYYHALNQDSLHHLVLAILVFLSLSLLFVIDSVRMRTHLRQLQVNEQVLKQAKICAEEADRLKSQFLATMSHEIRTPMYGVIGATELLSATALNPVQSDLLTTIQTSGETLLALIDDILDLAKIESGKMDLRPRVFELRILIASSVELVRQNIQDKPITLEVSVFPDVPSLIKTDADRLRQVLINLLGNAIKFTETGKVSLSVSLSDSTVPTRLNFSIRDTGVGIPMDRQGSLFKPFTRCEGANNQRFTGSGLGLSICKNLIEAQGGILSFSSLFGIGSTFTFSLPIEPFSDLEIPIAAEHPTVGFDASFARHYPLDILLVENHELNRKVAMAMLQTLGYTPDFACDGLESLDHCRVSTPDVILMDINLPGMDGLEAIRRIRKLPQGEQCYIVAFTASAFSNEIERFRGAGANDILTKPACFQGFTEVLRRSLDYRKQFQTCAPVAE